MKVWNQMECPLEPEVFWLIRNDVFPREIVVSGYPKRHSSADLWEGVDLSSPVMLMARLPQLVPTALHSSLAQEQTLLYWELLAETGPGAESRFHDS